MCGLVGIFDTREPAELDRDLLGRMNDSLFHRGPDAGGLYIDPGIGLGHRRLSIIDIASGRQPMATPDGELVVVFNGEIYNFAELGQELTELGHDVRTHSDTEVILHAWRQWGVDCVQHFRGMFAFALWDREERTLFLARDRLGIKPLYYSVLGDGQLIFGSELKALKCHPSLPRKLDHQGVDDYFAYGYIPEPRTIYQGVHKLRPGERMLWRRGGGARFDQYWDVGFASDEALSEEEAMAGLEARLNEAVAVRMVAEVPLGAFLSGGLDSSSVVVAMANASADPVKACSIAFNEGEFDESTYAAEVAQRYGCEHHVSHVDPTDYSLLDRLAGLYDEPFADSSAMPTYRVCELARRQVVVALSGDGGDENLLGYTRYRWQREQQAERERLPAWLRSGPLSALAGWPELRPPRAFSRLSAKARMLSLDPLSGYFELISIVGRGLRGQLFSSDFLRGLGSYRPQQVLEEHAARFDGDDPMALLQYLDLKTYLPGDILTKVDRASMAHALEVRVPMLDHPLVEWLAKLPSGLKLHGSEGKHLLKQAMRPHLSNDLLYRPKKGFGVPLADWFRGPLKERVRAVLHGPVLRDSGLFSPRSLQRLYAQHQAHTRDWSALIWSLLMFEAFLREEG